MKLLSILTFVLFSFCLSCDVSKLDRQERLIKEMWAVDSCGKLEYRLAIADYLSRNSKLKIIKKIDDVYEIFGSPYESGENNIGKELTYIVKASSNYLVTPKSKYVAVLMIVNIQLNKKNEVLSYEISVY